MNSNQKLLNEIEFLRKKMVHVAMNKGYTDIESIQLSQKLDKLLNTYENIKNSPSREV